MIERGDGPTLMLLASERPVEPVTRHKDELDLRYTGMCPAAHPSNPAPKASEPSPCCAALVDLLGPDAGHYMFARPGATLCELNPDLTSATADLSVRTHRDSMSARRAHRRRDRLPAGNRDVLNSVATYGSGDSWLDHADTEHIVLSDYLRGIDVPSIVSELAHLPVHSDDQVIGAQLPERSLR